MANSKTSVTEGSGKNVATYSFSEDATTKEVQRIVLNDSAGAEITTLPTVIRANGADGVSNSGILARKIDEDGNTGFDPAAGHVFNGTTWDRVRGSATLTGVPKTVLVDTSGTELSPATESTLGAMSAKLPTTLGSKADAASLAVTQSTEDKEVLVAIKTAVESTTPVEVFATGATLAVAAVTCSGAADLLLAGAAGRKSVLIASLPDSAVAYLGPSGVTTSDGIPIYPGEKMVWPLGNAALYGATASGTANLRIATVI